MMSLNVRGSEIEQEYVEIPTRFQSENVKVIEMTTTIRYGFFSKAVTTHFEVCKRVEGTEADFVGVKKSHNLSKIMAAAEWMIITDVLNKISQ